ncbi:4'-phosphopantetheinyl transferase superfamily protein [Sagittula stellata]|uniref:Enterobactin synthase component D n=1 Tax=Sagittula stellata (strain ATCC 700073 / DSM 11524 / E-37) TaxID=388399 RepID=A3K8W5_SAGS3|nr:4'-phosphopantetheinyl transferase superfamily protein [Sagittula stellata]EBA06348.1 phosphopantetheinyl transferase PptA, putative [Sagittula stellata E-37]
MTQAEQTLLALVCQLHTPDVHWGISRLDEDAVLSASEAASVARAVPARRQEFAAGRLAARRALAGLRPDDRPTDLPAGPDRLPLWPAGLTGSISHAAGLAVAAVARSPVRLGIDLEADKPLDPDLVPEICLPSEYGTPAVRVFSAKEAVFKAEYPHTRVMHGLHGIEVDLAEGCARYTDHPEVAAIPPESRRPLCVAQAVGGGLILSVSRSKA